LPFLFNDDSTRKIKYFNFDEWLENVFKTQIENTIKYFNFNDSKKALYLGNANNKNVQAVKDNSYLYEVMKIALKGRVNYLLETYGRSYSDVFNKKESYTEPLLVKIQKRKDGALIQTYYFNNDSSDLLSFYDTQIKENTEYEYIFSYYLLAIGTSYEYEINDNKKTFIKNLKNVIYVFEVPLLPDSTVATTVKTKTEPVFYPPATPTVQPIPYKDIKNQIKFVIQKNIDQYTQLPIRMTDSDKIYFDKMQTVDGEINLNKQIKFSSFIVDTEYGNSNADEFLSTNYEIFKLDREPYSYKDFYGKLYKTIDTDTFVETLEYNKKYYYTIREVFTYRTSVNEEPQRAWSNPSYVIEVQVINNSGVYYPIIKAHEFKEDNEHSKAKQFKKFLFIEPSYSQNLFDGSSLPDKAGATNEKDTRTAPRNIKLGVDPKKVWDKKFKIRLTSRQTGKKIDINYSFTHSNEEEINRQIPEIIIDAAKQNTPAPERPEETEQQVQDAIDKVTQAAETELVRYTELVQAVIDNTQPDLSLPQLTGNTGTSAGNNQIAGSNNITQQNPLPTVDLGNLANEIISNSANYDIDLSNFTANQLREIANIAQQTINNLIPEDIKNRLPNIPDIQGVDTTFTNPIRIPR
jgi:hypothetical protein